MATNYFLSVRAVLTPLATTPVCPPPLNFAVWRRDAAPYHFLKNKSFLLFFCDGGGVVVVVDCPSSMVLRSKCYSCFFDVLYIGDVRAQENPQLAILHTMMMREHNRIARALGELNPFWDDETLFQETRRIVVAELQHITYSEYLPAMLGMLNTREIYRYIARHMHIILATI